jgi:iron(III) transport system substrate-binding protein
MKNYLLLLSLLITTTASAESLTLYSVRALDKIKPTLDLFTTKTGIEVNVVVDTNPNLMKKFADEGSATPADLFLTKDLVYLNEASQKNIFQSMPRALANIDSRFVAKNQQWVTTAFRARTIMINPEKIKAGEITSYTDLTKPEYKGRLCLRESKGSYNQAFIASLVANHGLKETEKILKGLKDNLAIAFLEGDTKVLEAIHDGKCDVGITNTYYLVYLLEKRPEIMTRPNFTNEMHINGGGIGIVKHSKKAELAMQLIEFLLTKEAQEMFGQAHAEYPIHKEAKIHSALSQWGEFSPEPFHQDELGVLSTFSLDLAQRAGHF